MREALIDLETDELTPVAELCRKRLGRSISPATRWRWIKRGVRGGIRLEAVLVNGQWMTTPAAFAQFLREQTAAALRLPDVGDDSPAERPKATERKLRAAGLL